jgi:heme a synthase
LPNFALIFLKLKFQFFDMYSPLPTSENRAIRRFKRWSLATILATVFLIWVGGWVRSTGSGMGCPDWPQCFGVWIPPTSEAALPNDYLTHYLELRKKKNSRVAKTLAKLGFSELALRIESDPSVYQHEAFNVYKTWTEYINRLIGVLTGFLIFGAVIFAFPLRKYRRGIFTLSVFGFLGVGFEGWLGSLVVSTNLMPSFITVHMVLAMLILVVLIEAWLRADALNSEKKVPVHLNLQPYWYLGLGVSAVVLVQIILGTQVREQIDLVKHNLGEAARDQWVSQLGQVYTLHKTFQYFVAAAVVFFFFRLRSQAEITALRGIVWGSNALVICLITEILLGLALDQWNVLALAQPFHLLVATLIFIAAYTLTSLLKRAEKGA